MIPNNEIMNIDDYKNLMKGKKNPLDNLDDIVDQNDFDKFRRKNPLDDVKNIIDE